MSYFEDYSLDLSVDSPLNEFTLNAIAIYLIIVFILCVILNLLVLRLFKKYKDMRNVYNIFIIGVSSLNLIGSTMFPFAIHSSFYNRWTSFRSGCLFSGFVMYFSTTTNVYLMMLISLERYYILCSSMNVKNLNNKILSTACIVCILFGLFWATMPLIGWSRYSLEDSHTSCSVEWKERSLNVVSYNVCIFLFVFGIPFSLTIFANIKSIQIVKNLIEDSKSKDFQTQKMIKVEKYMTFLLAVYIAGYSATWIPYAFVSMYSAFINPDHISPLISTLPALFAKSSTLWSTVFYVFSNKDLKKRFLDGVSKRLQKPSMQSNQRVQRETHPDILIKKSNHENIIKLELNTILPRNVILKTQHNRSF